MLTMPKQETLVIETDETKNRAQALLDDLLRVREESATGRTDDRHADPMAVVTGRSSLDNAIDRTKAMITLLERASEALRTGLTDSLTPEERALLSEIDDELGPNN